MYSRQCRIQRELGRELLFCPTVFLFFLFSLLLVVDGILRVAVSSGVLSRLELLLRQTGGISISSLTGPRLVPLLRGHWDMFFLFMRCVLEGWVWMNLLLFDGSLETLRFEWGNVRTPTTYCIWVTGRGICTPLTWCIRVTGTLSSGVRRCC